MSTDAPPVVTIDPPAPPPTPAGSAGPDVVYLDGFRHGIRDGYREGITERIEIRHGQVTAAFERGQRSTRVADDAHGLEPGGDRVVVALFGLAVGLVIGAKLRERVLTERAATAVPLVGRPDDGTPEH